MQFHKGSLGCFLLLLLVLIVVYVENVRSIYLPWKDEDPRTEQDYGTEKEENQVYEYHETPEFKDDEDVRRYLKFSGRDVIIWRCRNALKPYLSRTTVIPYVDLYCSVMGEVSRVEWHHKHQKIKVNDDHDLHKYTQSLRPHHERGRQFTAWMDFRLRIANVTKADSGVYQFEVFSDDDDDVDQQFIYVDISTNWNRLNHHLKSKKSRMKKPWS